MQTDDTTDDVRLRKRELGRKLVVVARCMRSRFDENVTRIGVTRSQWLVIAIVARTPGLTQRTIAEKLSISEAAAGRLIDRLCTDGLIERRPRDDDRRAYSIFMTPAAQPHIEKMSAAARENEEEAFAGLTEGQLDLLDDLLSQLYRNVGAPR